MAQLGRYIIDRPTPPTAIEQLGGNVNKLGQIYMQKQLAEKQRKQKMEDQIKLLQEKSRIEAEANPMGGLNELAKGVESLGVLGTATKDPRYKAMAQQAAGRFLGRAPQQPMPQQPARPPMTLPTLPTPGEIPPQRVPTGATQPVFGGDGASAQDMITESATAKPGMFGEQEIASQKLISPKAEEFKTSQAIRENLGKKISEEQYLANKGVFAMYGQLKSLMSYKAAQFEEAGGDARPKIIWGWLMSKIKQPGYGRTGAFPGSLAQTSLRSAPLITGSVRIVRDITMMLKESFPGLFDPGEYTANKAIQSLDDFFRYSKGVENAGKKYGWTMDNEGNWVIPDLDNPQLEERIVDDVARMISSYNMTKEDYELKDLLIEDLLSTEPATLHQMKHRGQQEPVFKAQPQQQPAFGGQQYTQEEIEAEIKRRGL